MVVPNPQSADVSGVAAMALRCFLVDKYGEHTLHDELSQHEGGAAALAVLTDLKFTSTVPWSTILSIASLLHQHFDADLHVLFYDYGQFLFTWMVAQAGCERSIVQVSDTVIGFAKYLSQLLRQLFGVLGNTRAGLAFKPHCTNISSNSFDFGGFLLDHAPDAASSTSSAMRSALKLELHKGIMARASSQVFGLEIHFSGTELRKLASGKELQITRVSFPPMDSLPAAMLQQEPEAVVGLDPDSFSQLFPFHFVLDPEFRVLQAGSAIRRMLPRMKQGVHINEHLAICAPCMPWDKDYVDVLLQNCMHSKVVLISHSGLTFKGGLHKIQHAQPGAGCLQQGGEALVFLGSPVVESIEDMKRHDLFLSDFPPSDPTPDHILIVKAKHVEASRELKLVQERNVKLEAALSEALSSQDCRSPRCKLDTTSVADLILGLLDGWIMGNDVSIPDVLSVREALLGAEGTDLWAPMVLDAAAMDRDEEVNESLGLLLGATAAQRRRSLEATMEGRGAASAARPAARGKHGTAGSFSGSSHRPSVDNPSRPTSTLSLTPKDQGPGGCPGHVAGVRRSSPAADFPHCLLSTMSSHDGSAAVEEAAAASSVLPGAVPAATQPETPSSCDGKPQPSAVCPAALPSYSCTSWFNNLKAKLPRLKGRKHRQDESCGNSSQGTDIKTVPGKAAPTLSPSPSAPAIGVAAPLTVTAEAPAHRSLICNLLLQPSDKLTAALSCADDWQFDSFELERAANGRPLSCLAIFLMTKLDLIERLDLNKPKLERFLMRIEDGYTDHPYHNRTHAADVLRTLYVVMTQGGVLAAMKLHGSWSPSGAVAPISGIASQEEAVGMLSIMLAAIVHDYEHKGVNNDFLIRSSDPLALLYNDVSPLENHHVAASLSLLREEQYAFFPAASKKLQQLRSGMRKDVIDLVLATDMKQHFALSGTFSSKVVQPAPSSEHHAAAGDGVATTRSSAVAPTLRKLAILKTRPLPDSSPLDTATAKRAEQGAIGRWDHGTQMLVLKMALKCSDLGHLTSSTTVHRLWVSRLEEELFRQGDQERALGQPVSALMDRTKTGITKSQCGFINVVAQPVFELLTQAFPACEPLTSNLHGNLSFWKGVEGGMCGTD